MDTITHTLFGLTTYGAVKKDEMDKKTKQALLFSAIVASQIPDIDIVANVTETGRIMEQMWHRGLTHSIFLAPIWALLIYGVAYLIWKRKDKVILYLALINVLIHIGSDALNTWGTGFFEPFSSARITLGYIPIVDLTIWTIMLFGFLYSKWNKSVPRWKVWRMVWIFIAVHVLFQGIQGQIIHEQAKERYDETALSASFVPWHFTVIGKTGAVVDMYSTTVWGEKEVIETIYSEEEVDLTPLFEQNPKAEVLMQWSPFVVVVDNEEKIGIYDPRFYRNGESFLFEFITK
ncbi:metal-dependent hydrolase [Bacillus alkalicellulosilyticus]|uniref:metal-dependent hydrolase n=1 Tax=Alkalihalobacterium alkalicellulosilyticum TaxID=1912214 RepID=UPI0009971336|nr:metal-dependent hydrolase [Bacillus alkalicellulosilyticus]